MLRIFVCRPSLHESYIYIYNGTLLPPSIDPFNSAMATSRVLRASIPIQLGSCTRSFSCSSLLTIRYQSKVNLNGDDLVSKKVERKPVVALKASEHIITSQPPQLLVANTGRVMQLLKWKPCNLQPQMLIQRAIIDCRFFTLFAVLGSLLGSVLCFAEGCFLVIQSYVQYFHILSLRLDQGHVVQLLIEAIDTFLTGTAMLTFGVGLYVMFVARSPDKEEKGPSLSGSNLLGLFFMKSTPRWVGIQSIAQAKSKIGHAVMMILQVGLLEKFKDIPLVTGFDLACFAGAVLTSSACIFLLSRLHP